VTSSPKIPCLCILLGALPPKDSILLQFDLSYRRQRRHVRKVYPQLRHLNQSRSLRRVDIYKPQTHLNAPSQPMNQITKRPDPGNFTEENLPSKAQLADVSISKSETYSRITFLKTKGSIVTRFYHRRSCHATYFSCSALFRKRRRIMRQGSGLNKWFAC